MSRNPLPAIKSAKRNLQETYHAYYREGEKVRTSLLAKLRQDFRITESALVKNYIATLITFVRERTRKVKNHRLATKRKGHRRKL